MNCPSSLAPPMCCQPPMSDEVWQESTRRIQAARDAAYARFPKACPSDACGSSNIAPLFEGDWWLCGTCEHTWEVTDGR